MADITSKQKAHLRVDFFQEDGVTPATIAGVPQWSVDATDIVTIVPFEGSTDGRDVWAVSGSVAGEAVITVTANGDLSGGDRQVGTSTIIRVSVIQEAQFATITVIGVENK